MERLARHLGLVDGLLHTQFIATGSRIRLIETTRRRPGDLYSQLVELSTDYPYAKSYALPFLGRAPLESQGGAIHPVMRHTISVPTAQAFDHVRFLREVWLQRFMSLPALVGDTLAASPRSRVAVVFCRERDQDSLEALYATTLRREL